MSTMGAFHLTQVDLNIVLSLLLIDQ